jgi:hypothetical protein
LDGLSSGTTYNLEIVAYDDEGNLSTDNPKATITTSGVAGSSSNSSNSSSSSTQSTTTTTTTTPARYAEMISFSLDVPTAGVNPGYYPATVADTVEIGQNVVYVINFTIDADGYILREPYYMSVLFRRFASYSLERSYNDYEFCNFTSITPQSTGQFTGSASCYLSTENSVVGEVIYLDAFTIARGEGSSQGTFYFYDGEATTNMGGNLRDWTHNFIQQTQTAVLIVESD